MSYATVAEFRAGFAERDLILLTDLDGSAVSVDEARIQEALDDASAEIDSYIAKAVKQQTLPLSPVPRMLKVICRDLALHRLYINVGHDMETKKSLRSDAIAYLKSVASGDAAIGDGGGLPAETTSPGVAMTDGPERELTRDSLRGF